MIYWLDVALFVASARCNQWFKYAGGNTVVRRSIVQTGCSILVVLLVDGDFCQQHMASCITTQSGASCGAIHTIHDSINRGNGLHYWKMEKSLLVKNHNITIHGNNNCSEQFNAEQGTPQTLVAIAMTVFFILSHSHVRIIHGSVSQKASVEANNL